VDREVERLDEAERLDERLVDVKRLEEWCKEVLDGFLLDEVVHLVEEELRFVDVELRFVDEARFVEVELFFVEHFAEDVFGAFLFTTVVIGQSSNVPVLR
jgi:hypothetical protein